MRLQPATTSFQPCGQASGSCAQRQGGRKEALGGVSVGVRVQGLSARTLDVRAARAACH